MGAIKKQINSVEETLNLEKQGRGVAPTSGTSAGKTVHERQSKVTITPERLYTKYIESHTC